jgi:hypothetical protein
VLCRKRTTDAIEKEKILKSRRSIQGSLLVNSRDREATTAGAVMAKHTRVKVEHPSPDVGDDSGP